MSPRVLVTGLVLLALVLALVGVLMWFSFSAVPKKRAAPSPATPVSAEPASPPPSPATAGPDVPASPSEQPLDSAPATAPQPPATAPAPMPAPAQPAPAEVQHELESVGTVVRDYRNALGGNPVGTNAEITAALLGDNPKQTSFEVPEGSTVSAKGEMVDRWGTPYFFHQISGTQMEIRSAGPDRQMWTQDDVEGR